MATAGENLPRLPDIFADLRETIEFLDTTDESSGSETVQNRVKKAIEDAEKAVHMVNKLDLFSRNEELEEVATADVKYLLLPGFLGYLTMKGIAGDRFEVLKKCQVYYVDYLKLVKAYGVTDVTVPKLHASILDEDEAKDKEEKPTPPLNRDSVDEYSKRRQAKIERFKQMKQMEQQLKDYQAAVDAGKADESTEREYYTMLLKKWVNTSLEELESIESEIPILEHMAAMKSKAGPDPPEKKPEKPKPIFHPFILTRNKAQAAVIGAGYPSLPTYTVEEWWDKSLQYDVEPGTTVNGQSLQDMTPEDQARAKEDEDTEKENKVDNDDDEALQKARNWDDWRDDHRRGWGNTINMG